MSNIVSEKMKVMIVIDGDSAEELFAAGPVDLRDYFFPEKLNVKPEDVKSITFRKVTERTDSGFPTRQTVHKDNYYRDKL